MNRVRGQLLVTLRRSRGFANRWLVGVGWYFRTRVGSGLAMSELRPPGQLKLNEASGLTPDLANGVIQRSNGDRASLGSSKVEA